MKLEQTTLQKTFIVKHKGKSYFINYMDSNGQTLGLLNRNNWEVCDENSEELQVYMFQGDGKKKKEQAKKNLELAEKLVGFCIKHFEDYNPLEEKTIHC